MLSVKYDHLQAKSRYDLYAECRETLKRLSSSLQAPDARFLARVRFSRTMPSEFLSLYFALCVVLAFSASSYQFNHWFIIPVALCGVVIGIDAFDWIRGRIDLFDPVGIIGIFGLHWFLLAPLLQIAWNHQLLYLPPLEDWRPWLGHMAVLNLIGLVFYRVSRTFLTPFPAKRRQNRVWLINPKTIAVILIVALLATGALQVLIYARFGGVAGYINTFEESVSGNNEGFAGMGTVFAIAESFPLLLLIVYALLAQKRRSWQSWTVILIVLAAFFVVRIFFGGFRGSRSNTIFAMIWAVGVIHLMIRPVPRRLIFAGIVLGLIFMYILGFYKNAGLDGLRVLEDPSRAAELERTTQRTFGLIVLSDLARADIQAYVLQLLSKSYSDYQYPYGASYLGGILTPIPDSLFPHNFPTKIDLGTQALYGLQVYYAGSQQSSRNFGLAGEALLNFGPLAIPISFIGLGIIVSIVRRWLATWQPGDSRRLLLPLFILCCAVIVLNDTDNVSVFLMKQGLVPFVVVWLGSRQIVIGKP